MKKLFAIVAMLFVFAAAGCAQVAPPNPTNVMGAAAAPSLIGTYQGDYMAPRPSRHSFDLTIMSREGALIQGTVHFWNPVRACGPEAPFTGTISGDEISLLARKIPGCDRNFKLKVAGNGVLIGEAWTAYGYTQVKLTRKQ